MSLSSVNAGQKAGLISLAKPILDEGGPDQAKDLLIALEGIVVGTFLLCVKLGGDEPVAELFMERVKERLAEARLGPIEAEGQA